MTQDKAQKNGPRSSGFSQPRHEILADILARMTIIAEQQGDTRKPISEPIDEYRVVINFSEWAEPTKATGA